MSRKQFTKEFKEEAAKLYLTTDLTLSEVAEQLGVSIYNVKDWKNAYIKEYGEIINGNDKSSKEEDIMQLKKEIANLKMENEILKKATAIFSQQK